MLNRKTRMVNVRLSEDEYRTLQDVSHRRGENISELIRTTMQQVFPGDPRTANRDLLELWNRVQALGDEIENLRKLISSPTETKACGAAAAQ